MDESMEKLLLSLGLAALEVGIESLASVGKEVPANYLEIQKRARKALVELAREEATQPETPSPNVSTDTSSDRAEDTPSSSPSEDEPDTQDADDEDFDQGSVR